MELMTIKTIEIGGKKIGPGCSCFIIASVGIDINIDLNSGKKIIDAALEAGADAITFERAGEQSSVLTSGNKEVSYTNNISSSVTNRRDLNFEDYFLRIICELNEYAKKIGITLIPTIYNEDHILYFSQEKYPAIIVPPVCLSDSIILKKLVETKTTLFVYSNSGDDSSRDLNQSIAFLKENRAGNIIILYTSSNTPKLSSSIKLDVIYELERLFNVPLGYSDNNDVAELLVPAVALGAKVIKLKLIPEGSNRKSFKNDNIDYIKLKNAINSIRRSETGLKNRISIETDDEISVAKAEYDFYTREDKKRRSKIHIKKISSLFIRDSWKKLNKCDILLLQSDDGCGYSFHGKAYAHLVNSFGYYCAKKNLKVQSVSYPYCLLIGKRSYLSAVSYTHADFLIFLLQQCIRLLKGIDFSIQWATKKRVELWCDILDKTQPKIVIGPNPYEYVTMACKKKGIPIYNIQHGVIGDTKNTMYIEKNQLYPPIEELPDGHLCWDDTSAALLSRWHQKFGIRTIKVGNPWFLRFINPDPNDSLVQEALEKWSDDNDSRPCILVSLHGRRIGDDGYYIDPNCADALMIQALETVVLRTMDMYKWILRLHPATFSRSDVRDMTIAYLTKTFGEANTRRWFRLSRMPLPVALSQADLHITEFSSTVIEAGWFGVRSGLLSHKISHGGEYEELYAYERNIGIAEVIPQDADAIQEWIETTLIKGRAEPTMDVSTDELNEFIDEIIEK